MNPQQIELLFQASQTPELTSQQRQRLTLANPWTQTGPVSMVMQRRVAELEPTEATVVMGGGLNRLQPDLLLEAVGMELVQNEEARTKLHWLLH